MARNYRLLFLDIDGTLVGASGILPPRTLAALHRARERGCQIVLCTGRNRTAAQKVAMQIGGHGHGIVLNGALAFDWETGSVLYRALLPEPATKAAIVTAYRCGMAPIWMGTEETDNHLYTDGRCPLWPDYERRNASRLVYCENLAREMPGLPASLAAYGTSETTSALSEAWRQEFGDFARSFAAPTAPYGCWYAQLTSCEADKSLAAQAVANALNIPPEQTLAIGDEVNDLELLRWARLGICMGDGHVDVIACADHITGTLAEEGAAQAIERFVLD